MPSRSPGISVILRTSGRPRCYLERALASVRAQVWPPASVIISNDGAPPVAPLVPLSDDLPVLWLNREPGASTGRSAALNRGLAQAHATWVAFLDDDDTWAPDFLRRLADFVTAQPNAPDLGAVCCRTVAVYEEERGGVFTELGREPFNPKLNAVTLADLVRGNRFTNNAVLWRRHVFSEAGGYREDLPVLEDWEFNVRAASRFRIAVLPEMLACYHQRPRESATVTANSVAEQHDRLRAQLADEWRQAGLLPPDTGWHWLVNRWAGLRQRAARRRFRARWRCP